MSEAAKDMPFITYREYEGTCLMLLGLIDHTVEGLEAGLPPVAIAAALRRAARDLREKLKAPV
jgi:hypothetical protein